MLETKTEQCVKLLSVQKKTQTKVSVNLASECNANEERKCGKRQLPLTFIQVNIINSQKMPSEKNISAKTRTKESTCQCLYFTINLKLEATEATKGSTASAQLLLTARPNGSCGRGRTGSSTPWTRKSSTTTPYWRQTKRKSYRHCLY